MTDETNPVAEATSAEPAFDVTRLIDRFGGPAELGRRLAGAGYVLSADTPNKWRKRGSIPSAWLAAMVAIADAEGEPLVLNDYLAGGA